MRSVSILFLCTAFVVSGQGFCPATSEAFQIYPHELFHSGFYSYVSGEGEGETYREARHSAIIDAVRKLLLAGGYAPGDGFNIKSWKSVQRLFEDMLVKGKSELIKGIEVLESNEKSHREGRHKVVVEIHALKGNAPRPLEIWRQDRYGSGAADAVWHSLIIPGWGQFRHGRTSEGMLYLLGSLGAGGSAYWLHTRGEFPKAKRHLLMAAGGIYAVNLLDALFFCRRDRRIEVIMSPVEAKIKYDF